RELLAQTGFGSRTEYVPRAIDTERFAFQRRGRADVFLHCRGWANLERKGTPLVLEAARLLPEVPFVVRYQAPFEAAWPANVALIRALHGQPIANLSDAARARIEQRSWARTRPQYLELLGF